MQDFERFIEIKTERRNKILEEGLARLRANGCMMSKKFGDALELVDLSPFRKIVIMNRFLHVVERLQRKSHNYNIYNSIGSVVVSLGSLLTPALLSIKSEENEDEIFYTTWSCALATALASSLMQLFQVTKKHVLFAKTLEKLQSEGFQYFQLCGMYRTDKPGGHSEMFTTFCSNVEAIHTAEVSSEYKNGNGSEEKGHEDAKIRAILGQVKAHAEMVGAQLEALEGESGGDDEEDMKNDT